MNGADHPTTGGTRDVGDGESVPTGRTMGTLKEGGSDI
jgi:hypothetical protein